MCGICGKISYIGKSIDSGIIERMCRKMLHRGPDDEGIYLNNPTNDGISIGLGHRRLSIIDLSEAGHQPMHNEDKTIWVVYNGEIYNFSELKAELGTKGHFFKSNTDTEVIIHAYEEWGVDFVHRLRGMFAFGLWDSRKKRLLLFRDRVGKKPLFYYHKEDGGLVFASTLQSLIQDETISKTIDPIAIDLYLTYQYIPAPLSIFSQIKKLPPAHFLIWDKGKVEVKRYWRLDFSHKRQPKNINDLGEELIERLKEAVKLRMISDVPLGAFLSGGIDSSAIVALMSQISNSNVKTFTIGFEEGSFDERVYARRVAELYNTEHHEFVVKPNALEILPMLVQHYGEPYADSSAIPTYYLSSMTRQHVTVALNGDAGDENFAGYDRYVAYKYSDYYQKYFKYPNLLLSFLFSKIPQTTGAKSRIRRSQRFFEAMKLPHIQRYIRLICHFDNSAKRNLYTDDFKEVLDGHNAYNYIEGILSESTAIDDIERLLDLDINSYLPNALLVKVDVASMANSLEGRSPMLDHMFMEFVASIPSELKLRGFTKKYIFKKALRNLLPEDILNRPKMGFGVPVGSWLRYELKDYAWDLLMSKNASERGYFNRKEIETLLSDHIEGRTDQTYRLWNLLMLELWHRVFIDA